MKKNYFVFKIFLMTALLIPLISSAQDFQKIKLENGTHFYAKILDIKEDSLMLERTVNNQKIQGWLKIEDLANFPTIKKNYNQLNEKNANPFSFVGAGISIYSTDTKESSNAAFNLNLLMYNFYIDFSSNLSTGEGEELEFISNLTEKTEKLSVNCINLGYAIRMNKISIIPILGYAWKKEIFEDKLAFDTYFYGDTEGAFNAGAVGTIDIFNNGGIYLGFGTFERFKTGFWIGF